MKDRVPWHVKGVRRQARDVAREAARRSGMSVGQWLNNVIAQQAGHAAPPPRPSEDWREAGDQQLAESVNRLDRRLDQLISQGRVSGGPPAPPYPQSHGHYPPAVPNGHHAAPPPNGHYAPPPPNGQHAMRPSSGHYPPAPPNGHWSSGVDQAVAEIAARQRALDIDPTTPNAILPPVDYGHRAPPPSAPQRYEAPRHAAPPQYLPPAPPLAPAQHHDAPHHAAPPPQPAPHVPSPDLSGLEQQLRNITSQIENLNRPGGELTDALTELRKDLAEIGRTLMEAMPRHAVEALENEVRRLAERIDLSRAAGVDPSTVANMERGLADVREALCTLTPAESLVGFDDAVRGLTRKLDQMALQHDPANLQQLEAAITALRGIVAHVASNDALVGLAEEVRGLSAKVDRVASSAIDTMPQAMQEQPILGAIERGFAELTSRLVELQSHSLGGPGADVPAVDHLKRDLARTQDSLEAVHGTLGILVDRLAVIEGGMRDDMEPMQPPQPRPAPQAAPMPDLAPVHAAPMAQGPMAQGAMDQAPTPPAPQGPAPHFSLPATIPPLPPAAAMPAQRPSGPPPMRERQPIEPNLPPDFPLEPGSGVPRARPPGSAAERIAASEAALGGAKPAGANHPGQSNFIAAARRAAQAAGTAAEAEASQAGPAKTEKPAKSLTQRVRSLIVGGSAVLILAASMRIALTLIEPAHEIATETPDATLQALENLEREGSLPGQQSGLAAKLEGTFPPPAGLILPAAPAVVSSAAPVARGPDPDVTGAVAPRNPATPSPDSGPRPAVPEKLPAALRQAAIAADPAAEYEVALRHLEGRGVPQNLEEAARWLERAAKAGLVPAQFRLGALYEKGQGVKKNLDTARRHYAAAAEKGNAKAMHNMAVMYSEGIDGKPDYETAALWFRKAAEHGIADSQYNLGVLFARGVGVERNLAESYKWFSLAAIQGDRGAAEKRDDVAARLDQGSLMAAKLAVQTFVADPQPEEAITVKSPAGGWDGPNPARRPAKKQRPGAPLKVTPS